MSWIIENAIQSSVNQNEIITLQGADMVQWELDFLIKRAEGLLRGSRTLETWGTTEAGHPWRVRVRGNVAVHVVAGVELDELDALVNLIETIVGERIRIMETTGVIGEWTVWCGENEQARRLGLGASPRRALEDALDVAYVCHK